MPEKCKEIVQISSLIKWYKYCKFAEINKNFYANPNPIYDLVFKYLMEDRKKKDELEMENSKVKQELDSVEQKKAEPKKELKKMRKLLI